MPTYYLSPEEIFKGEIVLFDVNVFNPKEIYVEVAQPDSEDNVIQVELTDWNSKSDSGEYNNTYRTQGYQARKYYYYKDGNANNTADDNIVLTSINNSAYELKNVISRWYYTIRNIALVVLMLVLIYIGIRILLGSVASEKAKYKQMLGDWLVAMCLIFLMQYIMIFANTLVDKITLMLSSVSENQEYYVTIYDADAKLIEKVKEEGYEASVVDDKDIYWKTNLIGKARIEAQQQNGDSTFIGYGICFAALVIMTTTFIFTYLKRLLYVMFLTIIAPLVAMTYPLDKINDGQAQAFNIWLKEYIFNLLIQPFHLLLYTVLISMAFDLAGTNIIYSLVAIGFMMPAEKFLRNMFGFNKASTPGFLDGAAGAAMTITGIKSLANFANKNSKSVNGVNKNSNTNGSKVKEIGDRGSDSGKTAENLYKGLADEDLKDDNQKPKDEQDNEQNPEEKNAILDKYKEDGYGQNPDGEYYNPWTGEYDPDYNPTKDKMYLEGLEEDQQKQEDLLDDMQEQQAEQQKEQQEDLQEQLEKEQEDLQEEIKDKKMGKREFALKYAGARFKNAWGNTKEQFKLKNLARNAGTSFSSAATLGLGATGAAIGVAAGIASGKPQDVLQNAIAGGFAGSTIGKGASNRLIGGVTDSISASKTKHEEALKEAYGSNYSQYQREQADKEFVKDSEVRKMYQRGLDLKSSKDVDAALEDAKKYRQYGITDDKVIMKAMKLNVGNPNDRADKEKIATARLAVESKSLKELETNMKRFAATPGMKKSTVERIEKNVKQINNL